MFCKMQKKKPFTKHQKIYSPNDVLKAPKKKKNDLKKEKKSNKLRHDRAASLKITVESLVVRQHRKNGKNKNQNTVAKKMSAVLHWTAFAIHKWYEVEQSHFILE